MEFFNPYISKKKTDKRISCVDDPEKKTNPYCRLVPKCFKTPGVSGVISITTTDTPVLFHQDKEYPIFTSGDYQRSYWSALKPTPVPIPPKDKLFFHVYDIIETIYTPDRCPDIPIQFQTDIIPNGTVLKLLGKTQDGASVCVNVFQQMVYFYVLVPDGVNLSYVIQQTLNGGVNKQTCKFSITQERKKILKEYDPSLYPVYKITLSAPTEINQLVGNLTSCGCEVFESNVNASTRFIIDNKFSTFGWYSCSNPHPRISQRDSRTDLEFDCGLGDLQFHEEEQQWPPYTIMSFDIECIGEQGFPCATKDEDLVIQISCIIWTVGSESPPQNILLSLGTCDPIANTDVYEFPSELDMFYAFFTLLRDFNIDFVTGYNIANFDFPYIIDRATQVYNIPIRHFTKVISGSTFEVNQPMNTGAGFMRSFSKIKISGLVPIDMYQVCKDKLSLSDYKLNTVAKHCMGTQKEDVTYKEIPSLFRSGEAGRARIGSYCVLDSVLVLDLLKYFMIHVEISEIAKMAKIPARRVLTDGQQIRVFSCLLEAAKKEHFILPIPGAQKPGGYQGATVINPIPGFYNTPILVVDFASLYPSIIQAHNLCYSTMIQDQNLHLHHLKPDEYETFHLSTGPIHFVKQHKTKSLLSTLLTAWLAKRKAIRKELANCDDGPMKTILDKQQLAIKVTCNSVYGFTGVASGILPCIPIAETVTLQGRTMLEKSKAFVEMITPERLSDIVSYPVPCDPDASFRVIYGDTDSLFIECRGYPMQSVLNFADKLTETTTKALFKDPIKLEAEKTFQCLLMLTKKRYIGILSSDKLVMKGVDLIRKTACSFVQTTSKEILDLVLRDPEVKQAAQYLCRQAPAKVYSDGLPVGFWKVIDVLNNSYAALATGKVSVESLTFSTELSRPFGEYKTTTLPHLTVYRKIMSRNEELPQIHDRIPYVFIKGDQRGCKSDLAEDPTYVSQNKIPISVEIYFDKLIHGVANILQCLFGNNSNMTVEILYNFVNIPYSFT
uniref:DNA polymerase n=1 Tax=Bovine herpesvirus 4 TaxID=10385 RepID=A0A0F6N5A5_BHV4|nr:DNA polymerase [Bovine gammaherpesvirus 4]QJC19153.1 DNA polymerase [Bovine gammaherpesvirus 4]